MNWREYFFGLARFVRLKSKDPSTQVGAVAHGPNNEILGTGFNGFPIGVVDDPHRMERPQKYFWTAHAEENLVAFAARKVLNGSTVYITHFCCAPCARMMIQAGVRKIVCDDTEKTKLPPEQFDIARTMLIEAGVEVEFIHAAK